MAELGRKITCSECGVKFYDLGRSDVTCPKCGHVPETAGDGPAPKRSRRSPSRSAESGEAEESEELEVVEGEDERVESEVDEALDIEAGDDDEEDDDEEEDEGDDRK